MKSAIAIVLMLFTATALPDNCKYSKVIEQNLDLGDSTSLSIRAGAGDLDVSGTSGSDQAVIRGKVCVSKEDWLDDMDIEISEGENAIIATIIPDNKINKGFWGFKYAYIDLKIDIPDNISLEIRDSSGDMDLEGIGATEIMDSSGDIEINRSVGPVEVHDSSGDIEVEDLEHGLTIVADSSGDIDIADIRDHVVVEADSSGDITVADVDGNVLVKRDSSGDISARRVSGDFSVLRDGSGEISSRDIAGEIEIPKNKM